MKKQLPPLKEEKNLKYWQHLKQINSIIGYKMQNPLQKTCISYAGDL